MSPDCLLNAPLDRTTMVEINRHTPRNGAWTDLDMETAMTGYFLSDLHRLGILLSLHLQPRQLSQLVPAADISTWTHWHHLCNIYSYSRAEVLIF